MNRHTNSASGADAMANSAYTAAASSAVTYAAEIGHRATSAVRRLASAVRASWRERAAAKTLSSLDDRTLKDIGVSRSEIPYLANRHANTAGIDYRDLLKGR